MLKKPNKDNHIILGKRGENHASKVRFSEPLLWQSVFGEGTVELLHQRKGDEAPYPVVLTVEDGIAYWHISSADTAIAGEGKCELRYMVDDVVVKSRIFRTTVLQALGDDTVDPPEPQKPWVDQVLEAAEKIESATTHQPIISESNTWLVWDADSLDYVDTGISAKGVPGEPGEKGEPGDDYILTEEDKDEIATMVISNFVDVSEVGA